MNSEIEPLASALGRAMLMPRAALKEMGERGRMDRTRIHIGWRRRENAVCLRVALLSERPANLRLLLAGFFPGR